MAGVATGFSIVGFTQLSTMRLFDAVPNALLVPLSTFALVFLAGFVVDAFF